jgi:hypothetical protein
MRAVRAIAMNSPPKPNPLFPAEPVVAQRQPKTDRLVLLRFLEAAAADKGLDQTRMRDAHAVLLKWADLESTGRLAKLTETQFQGDFLAEVFGEALDYKRPLDGAEGWNYEQHRVVAGQTPDALLGHFGQTGEPDIRGVVELKGPGIHLDRDRSNGRTAVDQCWDYLVNTPPECRWGIVSNIVSFRRNEWHSVYTSTDSVIGTPIAFAIGV